MLEKKTELLFDKDIYTRVIQDTVVEAKKFLWIATSDLKDLYVHKGKNMVPFLEIISDLLNANVLIRLLHAKEPGPRFRDDFDKYPALIDGLERMLCSRVHFKSIIVDGRIAYSGSANLTGAGIGAKSINRRNFESGILTGEPDFVNKLMEQFDSIWMGLRCPECRSKQYCTEYLDM